MRGRDHVSNPLGFHELQCTHARLNISGAVIYAWNHVVVEVEYFRWV